MSTLTGLKGNLLKKRSYLDRQTGEERTVDKYANMWRDMKQWHVEHLHMLRWQGVDLFMLAVLFEHASNTRRKYLITQWEVIMRKIFATRIQVITCNNQNTTSFLAALFAAVLRAFMMFLHCDNTHNKYVQSTTLWCQINRNSKKVREDSS